MKKEEIIDIEDIDNRYRELATAIVAQTCEDYVYARRRQFQKKLRKGDTQTLNECVEFFNSPWYRLLINNKVSGDKMMEKLDEIARTRDGRIVKLF